MWAASVKAQTTIQPCTPISTVSSLPFGMYLFISGKDTVALNLSSAIQVVDTAGIINAYLAAHPCPICPIVPPQRIATGINWDIILNKKIITYSDGSTSTL